MTRQGIFEPFCFLRTASAVLLVCAAAAVASPSQSLATLATFDGANGQYPNASLVQGPDGNIYGTTPFGGPTGSGTVFSITPEGALTLLYSFCSKPNCADGTEPVRGMVFASDGDLYGTTSGGGAYGGGTIFRFAPHGRLTTLYSFCALANCADGSSPQDLLIQAADGNLYGTTNQGGASGNGTVFKISTGGTLVTLYSFCTQANCPDGASPVGGLIQASDGNFYGTTSSGGANNNGGTVFKMTPPGVLTTLYSFCAKENCADGSSPLATLIQATDGNFYGTAGTGGHSGNCWEDACGTVFRITAKGIFRTLYTFCTLPNCPDGNNPGGSMLAQGTDGNLYGTTSFGGAYGAGTTWIIRPGPIFSVVHSFDCTDGCNIAAGVVQATSGIFYGATFWGGTDGDGTVFSLDMGLSPFVNFVRGVGQVGREVQILGQGFTGATGVSFNGASATFTVKLDTYLVATVPAGATDGPVTVTTPTGMLTSDKPFHVLP